MLATLTNNTACNCMLFIVKCQLEQTEKQNARRTTLISANRRASSVCSLSLPSWTDVSSRWATKYLFSSVAILSSWSSFWAFDCMKAQHSCTHKKRLKPCIAFNGIPMTELQSITCHMGSHSVTCHQTQVNTPRHNSNQPGQYSIYLPRRDGRLSRPR